MEARLDKAWKYLNISTVRYREKVGCQSWKWMRGEGKDPLTGKVR